MKRKKGAKTSYWKGCLVFPKVVISTTSKLLHNWPYCLHNDCQKILCSQIYFCSLSAMIGNTRKRRSILFHREDSRFYWKVAYRLLGHWKWSYNFHNNCWKSLWTIIVCSLGAALFHSMGKREQISFFTVKILFFWTFFLSFSLVLKQWSCNLHNICQNRFWTQMGCSILFFMCDKQKNSLIDFFTGKRDFLFQKL